jgi:DnaJ family protein A protein 2
MFFGGGFPGFSSGFNGPQRNHNVDNDELYEILGVPKNATEEEIKRSYRKLAKEKHPDKGGNKEEFIKIQAAYEVLNNPEKRELYDQYGIDGVKNGPSDPFESAFAGMWPGGKQGPKKMKPTVKEVKVTLEDIYTGRMRKVTFQRQRNCDGCDGKGGKDAKKCTTCRGSGVIEKMVQLAPGFVTSSRSTCHECKGDGTIFGKEDKCKKCKGNKVRTEEKTIEVPIEQGAPSEHHVSFSGEGDEAPGVMAGDFIAKLVVEPHKRFERKGADLYVTKKISLYEALTGTAFYVEQLDGKKILIATAPNDVITPNMIKEVKGKGMPFYQDAMSHGNLYVTFIVEFPKRSELKNLEELKKILPVPKDLVSNVDQSKAIYLEDYDEWSTNTSASGGKSRGDKEDEFDDDSMPRGQRVQCAQQ